MGSNGLCNCKTLILFLFLGLMPLSLDEGKILHRLSLYDSGYHWLYMPFTSIDLIFAVGIDEQMTPVMNDCSLTLFTVGQQTNG